MSCSSCKQKQGEIKEDGTIIKPSFGDYILRFITFLITLVFLPFFIPAIIWMLFKTVVLAKSMNFTNNLLSIGKILKNKSNDPVEEKVDGELTEEDYEIIGYDDLTKEDIK